jgi:hypothetical protein
VVAAHDHRHTATSELISDLISAGGLGDDSRQAHQIHWRIKINVLHILINEGHFHVRRRQSGYSGHGQARQPGPAGLVDPTSIEEV